MDGSVNFYCNWASYVDGFGDPDGDYWLGLKSIHCLTARAESTLKVSLADFDGVIANYSFFSVGNVATKFRLNVGGYTGTASDTMKRQNGQAFSTFDQDNDIRMKTALRRTKVPGGMNNAMVATFIVNTSVERILQ